MLLESYLYLKSLHLIFVVCWFAGLFYVVRLFVYFCETWEKPQPEQEILQSQYAIMTQRLWNIITWPAAVLATLFGVLLLIANPDLLSQGWMHVKLAFLVLLWWYHFKCHAFYKAVMNRTLRKTSNYFRFFNEGATLILFAVIFLVILKNAFNWIFGVLGIFVLSIALMLGIRLYKRIRTKK